MSHLLNKLFESVSILEEDKYVPFQKKFSHEERKKEFENIQLKYPDKIPIILERLNDSVTRLSKYKFLVPSETTMSQFLFLVRSRMKQLHPEQALFFFVNNHTIPQMSSMLSQIYSSEKHSDGFLYIGYSGENTFG